MTALSIRSPPNDFASTVTRFSLRLGVNVIMSRSVVRKSQLCLSDRKARRKDLVVTGPMTNFPLTKTVCVKRAGQGSVGCGRGQGTHACELEMPLLLRQPIQRNALHHPQGKHTQIHIKAQTRKLDKYWGRSPLPTPLFIRQSQCTSI